MHHFKKPNLKYSCLSEFLTADLETVRVSDSRIPLELVIRWMEFCERKALLLALGCDASVHREIWESSDTNGRDEYLLEFSLNNKVEI